MKKKFNLWLNLITICFCVAALAVGVYSATTASITASGKIGFTAHGCDVNVSGYIYGHATGDVADGAPVDAPTSDSNKVKLPAGTAGDSDTSTPYVAEIRGTAGTLKIGNRYFSDAESTDGKPEDIVIVITATNVSNFAIKASVGTITTPSSAVTATVNVSTSNAVQKNGEVTFTITLSMQKTGNSYSEITMPATNAADNLSIPITFERAESVYTVTINITESLGSNAGMPLLTAVIVQPDGEENPTSDACIMLVVGEENVVEIKSSIRFRFALHGMGEGYLNLTTSTGEFSIVNYDLSSCMGAYVTEDYVLTSDITFTFDLSLTMKS